MKELRPKNGITHIVWQLYSPYNMLHIYNSIQKASDGASELSACFQLFSRHSENEDEKWNREANQMRWSAWGEKNHAYMSDWNLTLLYSL